MQISTRMPILCGKWHTFWCFRSQAKHCKHSGPRAWASRQKAMATTQKTKQCFTNRNSYNHTQLSNLFAAGPNSCRFHGSQVKSWPRSFASALASRPRPRAKQPHACSMDDTAFMSDWVVGDKIACIVCRRAKRKCDGCRPCSRCVR
jgi:hypothetical protein